MKKDTLLAGNPEVWDQNAWIRPVFPGENLSHIRSLVRSIERQAAVITTAAESVVIGLWKADEFSTDYEKRNDWKLPEAKGPMIVPDLTAHVESMRASVVDLSRAAVRSIERFCFPKTFLPQLEPRFLSAPHD